MIQRRSSMTSSDASPLELEAAANIWETKSMVRVASIDWEETPTAHVFKVDLPGLKKEEVKVEIEDSSILQISGHWNRESLQDQTHTCHRQERSSGGFLRRIRLPDNAVTKVDEAKATMEDGVLTLTLPKGHPEEPHVTPIQISA